MMDEWELRKMARSLGLWAVVCLVIARVLSEAKSAAVREAELVVDDHEWSHHDDDQEDVDELEDVVPCPFCGDPIGEGR